jgi:hypothetical protein
MEEAQAALLTIISSKVTEPFIIQICDSLIAAVRKGISHSVMIAPFQLSSAVLFYLTNYLFL